MKKLFCEALKGNCRWSHCNLILFELVKLVKNIYSIFYHFIIFSIINMNTYISLKGSFCRICPRAPKNIGQALPTWEDEWRCFDWLARKFFLLSCHTHAIASLINWTRAHRPCSLTISTAKLRRQPTSATFMCHADVLVNFRQMNSS
jgi:hypothetical protein